MSARSSDSLEGGLIDGVDQSPPPEYAAAMRAEPGRGKVVAGAGRQASGHDQRRRLRKPAGEPGFEVVPARGGDAKNQAG